MTATKHNEEEEEKEEVPKILKTHPEGGWGYMVALGKSLALMVTVGFASSFGLIFKNFLDDLGEQTSAITLLNSICSCSLSFTALVGASLFKRFSYRQVGISGAIIYCVGSSLTIFVRSLAQMLVTYSIFQGVGLGLMIPASFTSFNSYFKEKRAMVMIWSHTLIGAGHMVFPFVVQTLMDNYGFRGTLAVLAAINYNSIFGMLLMHPVEWHWREPNEKLEMKTVLNQSQYGSVAEVDVKSQSYTTNNPEENPLMTNNGDSHTLNEHKTSIIEITAANQLKKRHTQEIARRRASSIISLGNWTDTGVVSEIFPEKKNKGKMRAVVDFLDLTLLKDWIYVNMVFGVSILLFSDMTFFTLQPLYLMTLGWSNADVAICLSIGAVADLFSKAFLATASIWIKAPSRLVFMIGAFVSVFARTGFIYVTDFTSVLVMMTVLGFFRTWTHTPVPLVFAEYFSQKRFPAAYGLYMFLHGVITFAFGPIIGLIRDYTQSYIICFHALTVCLLMCAVPWLIEAIIFKFKPQKAAEDDE